MATPDAIVVGGGIIGLATALRLAEAGLAVTVLERGQAGAEASSAAAGMLLPQAATHPAEGYPQGPMQEAFLQVSCQALEFHPPFLEKLAELTGRGIPWRLEGAVCLARDETARGALAARVAWQAGMGLDARMLTPHELADRVPGVQAEAAAFFPEDGYVDAQALMPALIEVVRQAGVDLREGVAVEAVRTRGDRATGVRTARGELSAGAVVVAAGAWTDEVLPEGEPRLGMTPVRGQILALEGGNAVPELPVLCDEAWVNPRPGGRAIVGTTLEEAGYDRAVTVEGVREILDGVGAFLPAITSWRLVTAWAGLRPKAADGYPVIGPALAHEGLWLAAGHYRDGILWGPITGTWIAEGILTGAFPAEAGPFGVRRFGDRTRTE